MCSQDEKTTYKREKVEADTVSNTLTVTFNCACVTKTKMIN